MLSFRVEDEEEEEKEDDCFWDRSFQQQQQLICIKWILIFLFFSFPAAYNYPNRAHEQPNADNNNNWFGWSSNSNGRNSNRSPPSPSSADYQMHSKTSLSSPSSSNSSLRAHCAFGSCTAAAAFFACLLVHLLWHSWSPCTTADLMRWWWNSMFFPSPPPAQLYKSPDLNLYFPILWSLSNSHSSSSLCELYFC